MSSRRPANRTPEHVETWVVLLAHEHPDRGCRVLVLILERTRSVTLCHQTIRNVSNQRHRDDVVA